MCAVAGQPGPRASDVRVELFEVPPDWVEAPVPQTIGVPSLCFLSFSLQQRSVWRGRVAPRLWSRTVDGQVSGSGSGREWLRV